MNPDTIQNRVRAMLLEYPGADATMDPIYFGVIKLIDDELIGADEPVGVNEASNIRNEMRKIQRKILTTDEDTSLKIPIALYLDDYRRAMITPKDDEIKHTSIDETVEAIVGAIELYLLPKAREIIDKNDRNPTESAIATLFQGQLSKLKILGQKENRNS